MSQFNYLNDINNMFSMEGELTKGPQPRWQKRMETSTNSVNASLSTSRHKLSVSYNNSYSAMAAIVGGSKTPQKGAGSSGRTKKTPNGKTPGRKTPTPNKNAGSKTPSCGDRFIPNRAASNFELGHYMIKQDNSNQDANHDENQENQGDSNNGQRKETAFQSIISDTLQGSAMKSRRILSYMNKAPAAPESHQNHLKVVYSVQTPMSTKAGTRYIPSTPERILDAPDFINDYYLNLMDWSNSNVVTVALGQTVYLWNAATGTIAELCQFEQGDHACSLSWIQDGNTLAIGGKLGTVELWDCQKIKRLRVMDGHEARVGALAWNSYVVSSGSRDTSIIHHDVRQRTHIVGRLQGHSQEVCGLKWSGDYKYLASGGNDNIVNIWPSIPGASVNTTPEPSFVLNQHQAAVRALAWCPWQPSLLATGGGTADRCIKFWNAGNGTLVNSVDTNSQVCALMWSKNYKELISAHGYANNQLTIWKYPSMVKQAELTGHTARVLQMAMSPDGSSVMSAAADETLRLWDCFQPDPMAAKKEKPTTTKIKQSMLKMSIR